MRVMMGSRVPESKSAGNTNKMGVGIALGIAIGAAIGAALNDVAVGIGAGVGIGVAIGVMLNRRPKDPRVGRTPPDGPP